LLIKAKQQHGKNQNKNTGLFINCMDFVVEPCLGLGIWAQVFEKKKILTNILKSTTFTDRYQ
jgi:hypothetical protein